MSQKIVLDVDDLLDSDIQAVFDRASNLKRNGIHISPTIRGKLVSLVFLEDSTRTRMSFEAACMRLGLRTSFIEESGSSIAKGESWLDTFLNVAAMKPDLIVIRFGEDEELEKALRTSSVPIISAGQGRSSHVTQALLDAFTLIENFGQIRGRRVVIVGDIKHSRVATSNIRLLTRFGAEVAVLGPKEFIDCPDVNSGAVKTINSLDEALGWADVMMMLRIQMERLPSTLKSTFSTADFNAKFGLRRAHLDKMAAKSILMHPGPVNVGVELDREAMIHAKSRILQQTEHGVYIRAALLERILG